MAILHRTPCLWRNPDQSDNRHYLTEDEMDKDPPIVHYDEHGRVFVLKSKSDWKKQIVPIYECLHDDIESGQSYKHYHMDTRGYKLQRKQNKFYSLYIDPRPIPERYEGIIYLELFRKENVEQYATDNKLIPGYTGMKLDCRICPHKGYNLDNVPPDENGVIICPLHQTRIDSRTLIVL